MAVVEKWKPLLSQGNHPLVTPLEMDEVKRNKVLKRRKNQKLFYFIFNIDLF